MLAIWLYFDHNSGSEGRCPAGITSFVMVTFKIAGHESKFVESAPVRLATGVLFWFSGFGF